MRRCALFALGVVLVAGLVAAIVGRPASARVYTVAQVRAGLVRQPAAWVGRTVLVRGVAVLSFWPRGPQGTGGSSVSCAVPPAALSPALPGQQSCPLAAPQGASVYLKIVDGSIRLDPRVHNSVPPQPTFPILMLVVQPVAPNPLIALARHLPLLTRFFPTLAQVPGGLSYLYRIRLRPRPVSRAPCANSAWFPCIDGVLVGAQP